MKQVIHRILTITAALLLVISAAPVFADSASIKYSTPYSENATGYQLDGGVTVNVNVAEINALEMALSTNNLIIDLAPHIGSPSFDTDTLNILVGTTNATGYTLTMASSYDGAETTSLTRTESISGTNPTIDTIENSLTPTDFASLSNTSSINKWGYLLSATNLDIDKTFYNPILTTNTINSSTEPVYNDETSITFGAKVNSELPAGNYRATLKFTAVANYVPKTINDLKYMQDFKNLTASELSEVKDSMPKDAQFQLVDNRDNKTYWLSKLETSSCDSPSQDGKCYQIWMTQNLDLDLEETPNKVAALTSENTDLNSIETWTPIHKTIDSTSYGEIELCDENEEKCRQNINLGFAEGWVDSGTEPYSDDPGYRYLVPTIVDTANAYWWDNSDTIYDDLASCKAASPSCDEHSSMGNWYNFAAITASNGEVADTTETQNSICPAGWRLPQHGDSTNEMGDLYSAYGINTANYNPYGLNKLREAPFYLNRPGYIAGGSLGAAGATNNLANGSAAIGENQWYGGFNGSILYTHDATQMFVGINVRCLVR